MAGTEGLQPGHGNICTQHAALCYRRINSLGAGDVSPHLTAKQFNACLHTSVGKHLLFGTGGGWGVGEDPFSNSQSFANICTLRGTVVAVQGRYHFRVSRQETSSLCFRAQPLCDKRCKLNWMNSFDDDHGLNMSNFMRFLEKTSASVPSVSCLSVATAPALPAI